MKFGFTSTQRLKCPKHVPRESEELARPADRQLIAFNGGGSAFVGYRMWVNHCGAPAELERGVLTMISVVYLALIYLALTSQD